MTDQPNPFAPRKPGRPARKPAAPAAEPAPQRLAAKPSLLSKMKARPNWDDDTALMVGEEGTDTLKIPDDIVQSLWRDGIALEWHTRTVRGQEARGQVASSVKGGWTPVHNSDFDGLLDGMFLPKGMDDYIAKDDCFLVARPVGVHQRAKQRERALARAPLEVKAAEIGQGIPGVTGADHPSARSQNRINVTRERIEIPE
jgi:hypothetical protein